MGKDEFQSRFGDDPRRDDMTLLNPKQDDPTEQVFLPSPSSPSHSSAFCISSMLANA